MGDSLFYSRVGVAGRDQYFIFLFVMLINKIKEHDVFKILLGGGRDKKISHPCI